MRRIVVVAAVLVSAVAQAAHERAIYDSISLDGEWEMAYQPYAWEGVYYPKFDGVKVKNAVPGYWEDMEKDFRAAGMKCEFRINPWYEQQSLPMTGHPVDVTLPQIYGCFMYRRKINLQRTDGAFLRFEGVRNQVHVWINGRYVAFRAGFSTPFELPIGGGVLRKGDNEIVLAVSNTPNLGYCDYVCGLSTRAMFRSTGGVNGHLEMRFAKSDISDVYVTTAKDLASFTVHVSGRDAFAYEIADGDKVLAKGNVTGGFTLPTKGFQFWSPESPKRYDLRLTTSRGVYSQKFGIRRLVPDGEQLKLNGKYVYLRGVTEHCYFPKTIHLPRDLDYYRMITRKRKELGFNFVRFHTFVPPVEYLEAMDELGMLVQIESPNFVSEPEYAAIIAFARRHPSVVIYCTGNETRIDKIAEAYLRDVAGLVHSMTDSLFSPMSALRGIEYYLMPGKDPTVWSPFGHNAERMKRVAEYSDLFNSYQLGVTSYNSLNNGTPDDLIRWGAAYCGKPRLSHEICIDGSYADVSIGKDYPPDSPWLKYGPLPSLRKMLAERGLLDRADTYFRNSCEWMRRIRKFTFEKTRAAWNVAGFDFLGDTNSHCILFGYSVGMMDEFYRLKPGETVENVLRYNSAAVILSSLGSDFNVEAGTKKGVRFSVSNYDRDVSDAELVVRLEDAESGKVVWKGGNACKSIPLGRVTSLAKFEVEVPASDRARKYFLRASIGGLASNEWEIYAFPKVGDMPAPKNVRIVGNISEKDLLSAMDKGERVLLFGAGPFRSLSTTYRIGMAGRCSGNFATVIKSGHPALAGMPNEGFCGWQFRRLMENGRAVQLEAGVPFDPIIDVASAVKCPIRQAALFEYKIGKGRLLVCSFNFAGGDPAAKWLKARLTDYAASDAFDPKDSLTPGQLHAVISAPLISGAANNNRAMNPYDPASAVRAGEFAQP